MKLKHYMRITSALMGLVIGLAQSNQLFGSEALVFNGGPIITMDDAAPTAEAIAVRDGRILAVGSLAEVNAVAGPSAKRADLVGRTLLPGFVDSHSHAGFMGLQAMSANMLPRPDGVANNIEEIQTVLRDYVASGPALMEQLGWVVGFGYDDSQLREGRHPTRHDLDAVSTEHPIILIHQSGHLGVANSLALQMAGITAETPDPDGGAFRREPNSRQPNGVMEEYAYFGVLFAALAAADEDLQEEMVLQGTRLMTSYGYTTAQDGRTDPRTLAALQRVAARDALDIDVVAYPDILMVENPVPTRTYHNRFRIGGVKLTIDGSPQGKTAWLSRPYHVPPHGQQDDYLGYPAIAADVVNASVNRALQQGWQIMVHANGDAAIDGMIDAVAAAQEQGAAKDLRPVLIHGQTLRFDQVEKLDELGIFPSLFPMHTFYWGDWHYESVLGPERAENISPTGWVRERGMRFGTHHDAPVALPDSMRVLSATVTRRTREGRVLGPEQKVDVQTALKAMTLWTAWQHFEEDEKGSLAVGKLADLVVLSANPMTVDEGDIATIKVLETYKEGQKVYSRALN